MNKDIMKVCLFKIPIINLIIDQISRMITFLLLSMTLISVLKTTLKGAIALRQTILPFKEVFMMGSQLICVFDLGHVIRKQKKKTGAHFKITILITVHDLGLVTYLNLLLL